MITVKDIEDAGKRGAINFQRNEDFNKIYVDLGVEDIDEIISYMMLRFVMNREMSNNSFYISEHLTASWLDGFRVGLTVSMLKGTYDPTA